MTVQNPLLSLHYFPCLEYFIPIIQSEKIVIEGSENYVKQSYRNRCYILGSNKILSLTIPVLNGNSKVIVKDIKIDHEQKWLNIHWRSISSAYGKAPFFLYYSDLIKEILFRKHKYLFDLNFELLIKVLQILGLNRKIELTTQYEREPEKSITDLRSLIHPKINYKTNGIYMPCIYNQIFGREFVENISILDLLFCEGNNSLQTLKNSAIDGFKNK